VIWVCVMLKGIAWFPRAGRISLSDNEGDSSEEQQW
jgi:hypothetical protein